MSKSTSTSATSKPRRKPKSISALTNVAHIDPKRREQYQQHQWHKAVVDFVSKLSEKEVKLITSYQDLMSRGYRGRIMPKSSEVLQFPSIKNSHSKSAMEALS